MINFQNADLLSLSSSNIFLGDGIFRMGRVANLTIEGNVLDLTNAQGISGIFSGVQNLIDSSDDFQPIILNSIDFGSGKVNSWSFDAGTWVRSTRYSCQIQIFNSGNLYNMTGAYYSGLQSLFDNPATCTPLIRDLTETFDFQVTRENEYSYDHQVSLSLYSGIGSNPIQLAINIASGLIYSSPPFGFINSQWSGFYNATGKRYYTENYNLITNTINVGQRFKIIQNSGCYGIKLIHNCQTNEDGITNVIENAQIQGLCAPIYNSAVSGLQIELPRAFSRCSGVYDAYKPFSGYDLIADPISKNQTLNSFDGTINYSIEYTTNPFYFTGYYWEYTQSAQQNATIINVSEEGLVRGYGKLNTPEKFDKAKIGYDIVKIGILNRASGFYFDFVGYNLPLHILNRNESRSPYQGEISYSREFTDDPTFVDDPLVQRCSVVVNQTLPKHIFQSYNVLNTQELVQIGGNTELGQDQLQISLNTRRSGVFDVDYFINYCQSLCLGYKNTIPYSNVFYRDVNYNFDEILNSFDFTLTYLGASGKAYNNIDLNWP